MQLTDMKQYLAGGDVVSIYTFESLVFLSTLGELQNAHPMELYALCFYYGMRESGAESHVDAHSPTEQRATLLAFLDDMRRQGVLIAGELNRRDLGDEIWCEEVRGPKLSACLIGTPFGLRLAIAQYQDVYSLESAEDGRWTKHKLWASAPHQEDLSSTMRRCLRDRISGALLQKELNRPGYPTAGFFLQDATRTVVNAASSVLVDYDPVEWCTVTDSTTEMKEDAVLRELPSGRRRIKNAVRDLAI